jgi:hypothetical protein
MFMRARLSLFLLGLLLPGFVFAQDHAPIIAVQPYIRNQDIYWLWAGEGAAFIAEGDAPQLLVAPDGGQVALLDSPAFVRAEAQLEPGDYPDDLVLIDLLNAEQTPLLVHDETVTLSGGEHFYTGDSVGGVRTNRAWDDPNAVSGSRLSHFLAWSPDSSHIAQVQTLVVDGQYPGTVRLVVYDATTGEMSVIAELGAPEAGYAVFWFADGIVLYADPREGADMVTVYTPDGDVIQEWELDEFATLGHENPVRYEGRDYLAFPQWSLLDVATGERTPVEGTIALVSASAPADSLVLEACDDREALQPTWDVYTAAGEKLTNLARISTPALSPDGSRVVYADYEADRAVTIFDGADSYQLGQVAFPAESVLWGATVYTITTVGMDDCNRIAQG